MVIDFKVEIRYCYVEFLFNVILALFLLCKNLSISHNPASPSPSGRRRGGGPPLGGGRVVITQK